MSIWWNRGSIISSRRLRRGTKRSIALFLTSAALWAGTFLSGFGWVGFYQNTWSVSVFRGTAALEIYTTATAPYSTFARGAWSPKGFKGELDWWDWKFGGPRFGSPWSGGGIVADHEFAAPVWVMAAGMSIAGGLMLWRARRRSRPGLCPACGYDRAGLDPGRVCPECGSAASSATTTSTAP